MPSERVQRHIDGLLDEAEQAMRVRDWPLVLARTEAVLRLDPDNADARAYLEAAQRDDLHLRTETSTPGPTPPPLPAAFVDGRYAVHELLGEGGKKVVYRAHDTLLDRDVAFALVKSAGLAAVDRERVQREAQALAKLGAHPYIVAVFDLGEEADRPYLVTDYLPGGDLATLIATTPDHRLPLPPVLELATAIAQALAFAHERGVVHRDLKPSNIWLTEDGTPKLGDFGLAVALDQSRLTQAGLLVGTAAYLAPEQALGGEVTPRADLYSLGCLLYELVCGRPPYVGDESVAIIGQHLHSSPVVPTWLRPDCPPALEALILRLLEKDPSTRPASAQQVVDALSGIDPSAKQSSSESRAVPSAGPSPVYRRAFVGREQELRQLEAAVDAAQSGQGGLVMVVGEPGIGKTTLTEQLATYAGLRGGRVVVGHCYEEGSLSLPYLPFVEAMRSYVLEREPDKLRSELGSNGPEVARLVSEVRERVQVDPAPPSADAGADRYRLLTAITSFLRNAAAVQPLVLVLEDLHDADRGTLELLQFLARRLAGARLLVVGTYRDVEVDRAHPLSSALAELRRGSTFSRVALRGLTADEVQRMLFGISGQEVPWGLSEAVHRQTEGNPLFVQEVVRYLVEEGLITREGGRWHQADSTPLVETIPEGLRDVIGKRLSRLSAPCNRLLTIAAVIGRDFALQTLQAVSGSPEDEVVAALAEALKVAVLQDTSRPGSVRYRFAHAFFRQTLYEEVITPRRLRLHQQVARALEAQYAGRLDEHAAELAEHFAQSSDPGELAKAVAYGERAAKRASSVYAHGEAVRLLEQALEVQAVLDPDDAVTRCDLLLALLEVLPAVGEPLRAAEQVAPEAFALAEQLGDRARAYRSAVGAMSAFGAFGAGGARGLPGHRQWRERISHYATPGTVEEVGAIVVRTTDALHGTAAERQQVPALRRELLALARRLRDPDALYRAASTIVGVPLQSEQDLALAVAEEFAGAPPAGVSARLAMVTILGAARTLLVWGRREQAEAAIGQVQALAARTRDVLGRMVPARLTLDFPYLDGRLEDTLTGIAQFRALGADLGMPLTALQDDTPTRVRVLQLLGRDAEALAAQEEFFAAVPRAAAYSVHRVREAALLARLGRREEARALVATHRAIAGPPHASWSTYELGLLLEVALLLADRALLEETVAVFASAAPLSLSTHFGAGTCPARLLGDACALLGEHERAQGYYLQALETAGRIRHRPELALARLGLAELLAAGDASAREQAQEHLTVVVPELAAMGMRPALERAQALQTRLAESATPGPHAAAAEPSQSRRPRRRPTQPAGTVTFLFSDVVSSMPEFQRRGDRLAREFFRRHDELCQEQASRFGGHVYRREGDGFFIAFQSTREALRCAIAIQHGLPQAYADAAEQPHVRIGLHVGETVEYYGGAVNLAARVRNEAVGDQILVTELVQGIAAGEPELRCRFVGEAQVKGFDGTVRLYELLWREAAS
jgi:class 3 adenylate cyclase